MEKAAQALAGLVVLIVVGFLGYKLYPAIGWMVAGGPSEQEIEQAEESARNDLRRRVLDVQSSLQGPARADHLDRSKLAESIESALAPKRPDFEYRVEQRPLRFSVDIDFTASGRTGPGDFDSIIDSTICLRFSAKVSPQARVRISEPRECNMKARHVDTTLEELDLKN